MRAFSPLPIAASRPFHKGNCCEASAWLCHVEHIADRLPQYGMNRLAGAGKQLNIDRQSQLLYALAASAMHRFVSPYSVNYRSSTSILL